MINFFVHISERVIFSFHMKTEKKIVHNIREDINKTHKFHFVIKVSEKRESSDLFSYFCFS